MVLGIRHLCDSGLGSTFCCVSKVCIVFKEGIKKARRTLIERREMADINARPRFEAHQIKGREKPGSRKTIGEKEMPDRLSNKKRDAPLGEHPLRFLLLFPLRGVERLTLPRRRLPRRL